MPLTCSIINGAQQQAAWNHTIAKSVTTGDKLEHFAWGEVQTTSEEPRLISVLDDDPRISIGSPMHLPMTNVSSNAHDRAIHDHRAVFACLGMRISLRSPDEKGS